MRICNLHSNPFHLHLLFFQQPLHHLLLHHHHHHHPPPSPPLNSPQIPSPNPNFPTPQPNSMESPPGSPQDPDQNLETPATPSPTPSNADSAKAVLSLSPQKKPQPLPWSRPETTHLIQAYQEKWYSLKRGQLKGNQWEEVAATIAARCGYEVPTKTAVQCRHKIEKLRKRFRAEKEKSNPRDWEYFDLMESLESGPMPISARPMARTHYADADEEEEEEEEEEEDEGINLARFNVRSKRNRSKRISQVLRSNVGLNYANRPTADPRFSDGGGRGSRTGGGISGFLQRPPVFQKRTERVERYPIDREEVEVEEQEDEENFEVEGGGEKEMVLKKLGAEMRGFAEKFVKMERKKMEVAKETERQRMEMENKRMEMILESHRMIIDRISRAFAGSQNKKLKTDDDNT